MKTDAELKRDVMAELAWDPATCGACVRVCVRDGQVALSGHVSSLAQQAAVMQALRRVAGVTAVGLDLEVHLPPQQRRSDAEIASAAQRALRWHSRVPAAGIRLIVDSGWLTLRGEVDWNFQRLAACEAVRCLVGVLGVNDELTLKQRPVPANLPERIARALRRQAGNEAAGIAVSTDGAAVTLRGTVHSWHERRAAQGAAWAAPGVHSVTDELHVVA